MFDSTVINDPYIFCLEDVLTRERCEEIITKFENDRDEQRQGTTFGGVHLQVKNSLDIAISEHAKWKEEDTLFYETVNYSLAKYYEHLNQVSNFISFTDGKKFLFAPSTEVVDTGYQIQKTEPGKGYVWHSDAAFEMIGSEARKRELTYIIYLNDVEEGWTQFYNGSRVSPRAGRVLIFPATWTYVHQGCPPKNTKYIMTGWLHCKELDHEKCRKDMESKYGE